MPISPAHAALAHLSPATVHALETRWAAEAAVGAAAAPGTAVFAVRDAAPVAALVVLGAAVAACRPAISVITAFAVRFALSPSRLISDRVLVP